MNKLITSICFCQNENLTGDLDVSIKKIEQLQAEVTQMAAELKSAISTKNNLEESMSSKVQLLEIQVRSVSYLSSFYINYFHM